jgi:hypothetical protein
MVKFSIRMDRGGIVITKNLDTQQEYKTSDNTMQRFWDHLFPGVAYFSNSSSGRTEHIETFELDAVKAREFELGLTANAMGGSRRRHHRRRAPRKHNKSNRTFRKKSRATRRR